MSNLRKNFSKIYDEYIGKIYRFVFLKVNSKETAEDLTSEVFVRTWNSIQKGTKLDNPGAFLYRIARNIVIDYYRQRPQPQISLADYQEVVDPAPDPRETASTQADLEIIKANIANLNDDYREVITLRFIEDYSIPEIAKILDRPEGTVRVMLHRGLGELKARLNGNKQDNNLTM